MITPVLLAALLAGQPAAEALSLDDAIQIALENASDVVRARADVLLVDVEKSRALAPILPRVDLSFSAREDFARERIAEARYSFDHTLDLSCPNLEGFNRLECLYRASQSFSPARFISSGPYVDYVPFSNPSAPTFTLGLNARQLIYDGGRWWTVLDRVGDIREARVHALKVVRNNIRTDVVRRFYDLAKAVRNLETIKLQIELDEAQLGRARSMLEAGTGKQNDVATAERNLASDRSALATQRYVESSRRRALAVALAFSPDLPLSIRIPPSISVTATITPERTSPERTEKLLTTALNERPDVIQGRANVEVVRKNVKIREADFYPTVSLGAGYFRSSRRPDRVFDDPTSNFTANVSLDVNFNIFQGGAISANVQEGEIELRRAYTNQEQLERNVKNEVIDAIENLELQYEVFARSREELSSAEEALRLADGLYKQGRTTALELRDAEVKLTQARVRALETRYDIEVAREVLRRAIGTDAGLDLMPPGSEVRK